MAFLLAIESSTKNCSVAIFKDSKLVCIKERAFHQYSHGEQLTLFIEEVLKQSKVHIKLIDGIILSKGPGSYTGLRIGTATAKGLCYSLDIPLVSVCTLQAMSFAMSKIEDYMFYCPMIDARRMEVFSSVYDRNNNQVREIRADVVDMFTYSNFLEHKVLFFGDGAFKCKQIIDNNNAYFVDEVIPTAEYMGELGFDKFFNKDFEDIAYFEPYYLKDFVAGDKKKN